MYWLEYSLYTYIHIYMLFDSEINDETFFKYHNNLSIILNNIKVIGAFMILCYVCFMRWPKFEDVDAKKSSGDDGLILMRYVDKIEGL